jgi:hypothetical protein
MREIAKNVPTGAKSIAIAILSNIVPQLWAVVVILRQPKKHLLWMGTSYVRLVKLTRSNSGYPFSHQILQEDRPCAR